MMIILVKNSNQESYNSVYQEANLQKFGGCIKNI